MKISDIWVMSWYFMRHLMVCLCFLYSLPVCIVYGRAGPVAAGCPGLLRPLSVEWGRMYTVPASGSGAWLGPPAGTHCSSCWLSQSHRAEAERRYTVSAGFSWPAQWRSNTVSPVIMAITRTPWPPASLMPHGDSDKWTLVWSPRTDSGPLCSIGKGSSIKIVRISLYPDGDPWALSWSHHGWARKMLSSHFADNSHAAADGDGPWSQLVKALEKLGTVTVTS